MTIGVSLVLFVIKVPILVTIYRVQAYQVPIIVNLKWPPRNLVFLTFQHQTAVISRASSRSPCLLYYLSIFEAINMYVHTSNIYLSNQIPMDNMSYLRNEYCRIYHFVENGTTLPKVRKDVPATFNLSILTFKFFWNELKYSKQTHIRTLD